MYFWVIRNTICSQIWVLKNNTRNVLFSTGIVDFLFLMKSMRYNLYSYARSVKSLLWWILVFSLQDIYFWEGFFMRYLLSSFSYSLLSILGFAETWHLSGFSSILHRLWGTNDVYTIHLITLQFTKTRVAYLWKYCYSVKNQGSYCII